MTWVWRILSWSLELFRPWLWAFGGGNYNNLAAISRIISLALDGYIPWHQAKNSTYYHSFEYILNHLKLLRLKSIEESFYNSGEFSQVFQIDSRFISSTRTERRKKSRPALAINKMKKLFRHEHWNINNTPVKQIYRVQSWWLDERVGVG